MELGSNAPIIVMPDADLEKAATAIAATDIPTQATTPTATAPRA